MGRQDEIQLIAYHIWEEEGCCDGRDCEHWLKAEVIWEEKALSTVPKVAPKLGMEQGKKNSPKTTQKA